LIEASCGMLDLPHASYRPGAHSYWTSFNRQIRDQ